jgi:hypothetical protein
MDIKNIYDAKPVGIHILGKPAIDDLKRPLKAASIFCAGCVPPPYSLLPSLLTCIALGGGPKIATAAIFRRR